jgi:hypothetical protein
MKDLMIPAIKSHTALQVVKASKQLYFQVKNYLIELEMLQNIIAA